MGDYYSLDKRVTLSILLALVITNAIWVVVSEHSGPVIALVVYVFVAFLCWRRNHFQSGIIAGIVGICIHAYEFISWGLEGLIALDLGLLLANLILPIPLIYFSWRAYRVIQKVTR